MVSKFDSKEYVKQRLLNIIVKYFPKKHLKINTGRKGFRLGESTTALIDQSSRIIQLAEESKDTIPNSTVDVYRYGTVCKEIFDNLGKYQIISQLKSRSRRGYRKELEVVDYDLKKIELEFRKSPNPSIKSQKDTKFIQQARKSYIKLINDSKYHLILEDIIKKQELFVIDESQGKKFFDSLYRILNIINTKNLKKKEFESQLELQQSNLAKNTARLKEIEEELPHYKQQIESFREKSQILEIISEKEQLFSDPDLSLFLKIITTSLERYMKMIERRENRSLEEKEDFLGLILEPTKFPGLNEELWRKIVFIIETHGFEILSGKNWFKFDDPVELRQFIVQKDVLEKFAKLRKLEKKLNKIEQQLQMNPRYSEAQKKLQDVDTQLSVITKIKKEIPEIQEAIEELSKEIKGEEEKAHAFLN